MKKFLHKMFADKEVLDNPWADIEKNVDYMILKIIYDNTSTNREPEMVKVLIELLRFKMTIIDQRIWREK